MLYRFSAGISYYCYLFTFLLVYIVLILDCVGYFHRPKKPESTTISNHFLYSCVVTQDVWLGTIQNNNNKQLTLPHMPAKHR